MALDGSKADVNSFRSLYYHKKFRDRAEDYFKIVGIDVHRPLNHGQTGHLIPYNDFHRRLNHVRKNRRDLSRNFNKRAYDLFVPNSEHFFMNPANDSAIEKMGLLAGAKAMRTESGAAPDMVVEHGVIR